MTTRYDAAFSFPQRSGGYWCVWSYPGNRVVITANSRKKALELRQVHTGRLHTSGQKVAVGNLKGEWLPFTNEGGTAA